MLLINSIIGNFTAYVKSNLTVFRLSVEQSNYR